MKKLLLVTIIASSFTFGSKMRFTMEKDRRVNDGRENVNINSTENEVVDSRSTSSSSYETGDAEISPTNEKINTRINLRGSKSNKHTMLNKALDKLIKESNTYLGVPYLWGGEYEKRS